MLNVVCYCPVSERRVDVSSCIHSYIVGIYEFYVNLTRLCLVGNKLWLKLMYRVSDVLLNWMDSELNYKYLGNIQVGNVLTMTLR